MASTARYKRPGHEEIQQRANTARNTMKVLGLAKHVHLVVHHGGALGDETVELAADALQVLQSALEHIAHGHEVTVLPVDRELGTQEAADLLLVSRPYLVGLLDAGKIPYRKVGARRRLHLSDVWAYRMAEYERVDAILDELTAESQRLGLY